MLYLDDLEELVEELVASSILQHNLMLLCFISRLIYR